MSRGVDFNNQFDFSNTHAPYLGSADLNKCTETYGKNALASCSTSNTGVIIHLGSRMDSQKEGCIDDEWADYCAYPARGGFRPVVCLGIRSECNGIHFRSCDGSLRGGDSGRQSNSSQS